MPKIKRKHCDGKYTLCLFELQLFVSQISLKVSDLCENLHILFKNFLIQKLLEIPESWIEWSSKGCRCGKLWDSNANRRTGLSFFVAPIEKASIASINRQLKHVLMVIYSLASTWMAEVPTEEYSLYLEGQLENLKIERALEQNILELESHLTLSISKRNYLLQYAMLCPSIPQKYPLYQVLNASHLVLNP